MIGISHEALDRASGIEQQLELAMQVGYEGIVHPLDDPVAGELRPAPAWYRARRMPVWAVRVHQELPGAGLADPVAARGRAALAACEAAAQVAVVLGAPIVLCPAGRLPGGLELVTGSATPIVSVAAQRNRGLDALCRHLYQLLRCQDGVRWALLPSAAQDALLRPEDLAVVLEDLHHERLGYWYATDIGQVWGDSAVHWLEADRHRLWGCDLADVSEGHRGALPGCGEIDWRSVAVMIGRNGHNVLRCQSVGSRMELLSALDFMRSVGL